VTIRPPAPTGTRTRRRLGRWAMIAAVATGAAVTVSSPGTAANRAYSGPGMTIGPDEGPASLFPSTIDVDGVPGKVVSARVTLTDLVHSWTSDLNIALQSPDGRTVALMAGCRGDNDASDDVDGTLTFADDGEVLSDDMEDHVLTTGTYAPSQCSPPFFGDDGPQCPCGPGFASLAGAIPNGVWSLYVYDDENQDRGSLAGWTLELTTNAAPMARDGSFRRPEDTVLRGTLAPLTSDADDDDLDFGLVTPPAHGTAFVSTDGTFVYTPARGYVGLDRFIYRVDDGREVDQGVVRVTITDVPLPHAMCAGRVATIVGTSGNDRLTGTPGADVIISRGGNDWISGRGGRDTICAGSGFDFVHGGRGADLINGGAERDNLNGGTGNDTLIGHLGRDVLAGGSGNDTLRGSGGRDTLLGRSGDDQLRGGLALDNCDGGTGTDRAATCERLLAVP
jgi:subtilisin-like proprotein convertase family protein